MFDKISNVMLVASSTAEPVPNDPRRKDIKCFINIFDEPICVSFDACTKCMNKKINKKAGEVKLNK